MDAPTILERLAHDMSAHVIGTPAGEEELARLEAALGHPLPRLLRALLARFGGGLFYGLHEIFGPRRVLIHDIELVPDLLSMRERIKKAAAPPPAHLVPFHRVGGLIHLVDLGEEGAASGRVVAADRSTSYPDSESFFARVVLPSSPVAGAGPPKGLDGGGAPGSR